MMKKLFPLFLGAFLLVGCRSPYDITLRNGQKFSGVTKPALDKRTGKYHFKTMDGSGHAVHQDSIRLIEPHRDDYEFRPTKPK